MNKIFNKNIKLNIYFGKKINFYNSFDLNNVNLILEKIYGSLNYLPIIDILVVDKMNNDIYKDLAKLIKN